MDVISKNYRAEYLGRDIYRVTKKGEEKPLKGEALTKALTELVQTQNDGAKKLEALSYYALVIHLKIKEAENLFDKENGAYNAMPRKEDVLKMLNGGRPEVCFTQFIARKDLKDQIVWQ